MPDDRLFHKRLGHSEKVGRLTDFEYIVWQAYILSADDFGVLRFTAVSIQADHDRLALKPLRVVQKALACVCGSGLLRTFDHQGQVYGYQHDWQDWQHVDYPRLTIHPMPPPADLETCTEDTRKLFLSHPGGWRGKKKGNLPTSSAIPPEGVGTPSATPSESFRDTDPLAVSRKPVASSREPLAVVPAADARSGRPIFKCTRFVVFEWQLDDLRRLLGTAFEAFDVHRWFFDLSESADAAGLVVPQRDGGKWLQEQTLAEATRRGLAVATTQQGTGKTAGNAAAAARFVARGQR